MSTTTKNYRFVEPAATDANKVGNYNDALSKIEAGRTLQRTAGVTVLQYQAVYLDSLGKMQLALDTSPGPRMIVAVGATSGALGYCQTEGIVTNPAWTWTVGSAVYISGSTAGSLTQTAPTTTSIPIGIATAATEMLLTPWVWIATPHGLVVLVVPGDPGNGTMVSIQLIFPRAGTIVSVKSTCRQTPTGNTYLYDIMKNGSTIYTTTGNRPTRLIADGTGAKTHTLPDVVSVAAGDVFRIDQITSGTGILDCALQIEIS